MESPKTKSNMFSSLEKFSMTNASALEMKNYDFDQKATSMKSQKGLIRIDVTASENGKFV